MKKIILISLATFSVGLTANAQQATTEKPKALEAEVGIVSSDGNTKSESYLAKAGLARKYGAYHGKLSGTYLRNEARDNDTDLTTSFEKWDAGIKLERELTEKFSIFVAQNIESDKDAGLDRKYNSDIGGKYFIAQSEGYYTFTEVGYRFTTEEYLDGADEEFHLARIYLESEKFWKPDLSTKGWVEYLPNIEESDEYRLNAEASVNMALNNVFSLKTAYQVKYNNEPETKYRTDSLFLTSLVAKF